MMNYSRKDIKLCAKNDLRGRWPVAIAAMLLALFVPSIVVSLPGSVFSFSYGMAVAAEAHGIAALSYLLSLLLNLGTTYLIVAPLMMGYVYFTLRISRHQEANALMPYRAFSSGVYGRVTLGYFMMSLFVMLWSLLFVIPGIIKSFSYAMLPFIMMDDPSKGWKEALQESRSMMNGHKWEYFVLLLSFLGWLLLVAVTLGIAALYVLPYMQQAEANFYRTLKGEALQGASPLSYERPQM